MQSFQTALKQNFQRSYVRDAITVGSAVSVFGFAFGVLATSNGATPAQTIAMSLLVFTGASQFAVVGILSSGGSAVAAVSSALLLAARNGIYGFSMGRYLPKLKYRKALASQLVIDESTALSVAQPSEADRGAAFLAGGLSVFFFWNAGTVLGAFGGDVIGDPLAWGLDAAFPAGFISLMAPSLKTKPGLAAAMTGAAIALATTPLVRPGVPVLLAAVGAVVGFVVAKALAGNKSGNSKLRKMGGSAR